MTSTEDKIQVVYADSDTLSSYLNRGKFGFFITVFEALGVEVIIPKIVMEELCRGRYGKVRESTLQQMIRTNRIVVREIEMGKPEADTYYELSQNMGQGEAAALALAKNSNRRCVVASNNYKAVIEYAEENDIELWPTTTIMMHAIDLKIMSMNQANDLWIHMKRDGLKLPDYEKFEDLYNEMKNEK